MEALDSLSDSKKAEIAQNLLKNNALLTAGIDLVRNVYENDPELAYTVFFEIPVLYAYGKLPAGNFLDWMQAHLRSFVQRKISAIQSTQKKAE